MRYVPAYPHPKSTKARTLALMEQFPSGMGPRKLSAVLEVGITAARDTLAELGQAGMLVSVIDGSGKSHQSKRWCLPQHKAVCLEAAKSEAAAAPAHWKKAGLGSVAGAVKRTAHEGEPIKTIAEPPRGRFEVDQVEPFFSRPGYSPDFIGHDTWAARLTAGAK